MVALVLVGAGCSSPPPDRAEVIQALRTSGIPAAQARCAADAIYDNLTNSQIRQLVDRGNGGTPKDDPTRTDDTLDKLNAAMAKCRALTVAPTATSVPTDATTTTAGASIGTAADTGASSTTSPPVGSTDPPSPSSTTLPATTASR
jgi:hypothetical protein